jgi:hypothetical protein
LGEIDQRSFAMSFKSISRRTVLRGLGASMALPLLDAMAPSGFLRSAIASGASTAEAAASGAGPLRMAMFFLPNGMNMEKWKPQGEGADWQLPATLEPLEAVKKDLTVISGLALDAAKAHQDGAGDHARSAAAFLTGAHPHKTAGADIHLGVSMDQVAAQVIGGQTRLPSLELGLDKGSIAGECDSGYSCAYVSNISWRTATSPMPHETNPADVFDRLFGSDNDRAAAENRARRLRERKSILDFVSDDNKALSRQLGKSDQGKLDEFTTSVREIEKRVESARVHSAQSMKPGVAKPKGIPEDFSEYMRLMTDMMVLAFRMDITRVSTFLVAHDGSDRTYRNLDISEGHHAISHHGGNPDKLAQLAKINHFHVEQLAYFLKKLKGIKEGNGTLLDNSMVLYGCGIGDGNRHNHNDLPILMAGRGGGSINPGRHIKLDKAKETPLCNVYLSMLDRMGVKKDRFGDSTGMLTELSA